MPVSVHYITGRKYNNSLRMHYPSFNGTAGLLTCGIYGIVCSCFQDKVMEDNNYVFGCVRVCLRSDKSEPPILILTHTCQTSRLQNNGNVPHVVLCIKKKEVVVQCLAVYKNYVKGQ